MWVTKDPNSNKVGGAVNSQLNEEKSEATKFIFSLCCKEPTFTKQLSLYKYME